MSSWNPVRHSRAARPAFESCEVRDLPAAYGIGLIGLDLYRACLSSSIGQGLNIIINRPADGREKLEEIRQKIDEIDKKLDVLQGEIRQVQSQLDQWRLAEALDRLQIDKIEKYWDAYDAAIANGQDTPEQRARFKNLTDDVTKNLADTVDDFRLAFLPMNRGVETHPALMRAFSQVLIDQSVTGRYVSSAYTEVMDDGFNYYVAEMAKAATLLLVSYRYQGEDSSLNEMQRLQALERAKDVAASFPTPNPDPKVGTPAERKRQVEWWAAIRETMPEKPIPDYLILDTRTQKAWNNFNLDPGGGLESFDASTTMLYLVRGGYDQFIDRYPKGSKRRELATDAYVAQLYINGGVGFLDWRLPSRAEVQDISPRNLEQLVAAGFNRNAITYPVYTPEISQQQAWKKKPGKINPSSPSDFERDMYSTRVAVTPSTGGIKYIFPDHAWYKEGSGFRRYDGKGANAMYVANVRLNEFFPRPLRGTAFARRRPAMPVRPVARPALPNRPALAEVRSVPVTSPGG